MKAIDARALFVGAKMHFMKNPEMLEAIDTAVKLLDKEHQLEEYAAVDHSDDNFFDDEYR